MPHIRIENWPMTWDEETLKKYMRRLRTMCVRANLHKIDSEKHVTVTAGAKQLLEEDDTLMVIVEGLFDLPERTKGSRDRLAQHLADAAFVVMKPGERKIEVLIYRFNPEVDSYVVIP